MPLTNATVDLLQNMLDPDKTRVRTTCLSAITGMQNKTFKEEDFTGGNIARVLIAYDPLSLRGADLRAANLQRADLREADLVGADLYRARITPEQLADTRSLQGATMPNGQKYEDWRKDKEGSGKDVENE
jgi:uncharacterized protein YjbI with pentapeptide repeats